MKKLIFQRQHFLPLCSLILIIVFNACQDDSLEKKAQDARISINTDGNSLNRRMRVPQVDELISINEVDIPLTNGRTEGLTVDPSNYTLVLRAEVEPPVLDQQMLRASHVFIENDLAFVSYNTEGPAYKGGFEVFDISDIKSPKLIYQTIVEGTDYSSIYYENGKVYLAGATANAEALNLTSSAMLEIFSYPAQEGQASQIIDIPSFTATDVKIQDNFIYVTSGSHGGLSIFDKTTLEEVAFTGLDDARSIAFNDTHYAVMQGTPARIKVYQISDNSYVNGYKVGGANIPESKSILSISEGKLYVPCGREGLKVIDLQTGALISHMELPLMEGIDENLIVTNGVSVNQNRVFSANGAAGIFLSEKYEDQLHVLGSVDFQASSNYVESKDNVMFVATGTGGLTIIEIVAYDPGDGIYIPGDEWDDNGVPQNMCDRSTPVSQELKDLLAANFVPRKNIIQRKPQYFGAEVVTDLFLEEDTDLQITFYSESAGWTNSFGYYIYDPAMPPQSMEDLKNMTILFPNVSVQGSKGLMMGDKICLRDLKKGTAVGFFLIARGWMNNKVTSGIHSNFTTQALNTDWPANHRQPSVLLDANADNVIILSFEDVRLPGGDKDFDDAVFLLEPSNPASINYSQLVDIQ
ncbi:MAG: DUF4114 domain-containing protein [Cyclobacteriaceae bacterium]